MSCLARTVYLYHHCPYAPDTRWLSWFYSSVALGEEVCFGTAISWGQAVCVPYITPITQILYLVSIGQHHVPLHLMVWWPLLLPVSCIATRFCHCTSLIVSVEGHHQTCLLLKNPLPQVVWSWPKACLSLKACCCIFISSIAQEHLPWPIFHVAPSLSFLWARHNTTKLLTYSVLPKLVHTDKCAHGIGICWGLVLSVGCKCAIFGSQDVIWWWIWHWASKSSTEQFSRNVIYLLAPAIHMVFASHVYDQYSCATLLLGSFAIALMRKTTFLYQLISPHYWINLYAF